MTWNIFTWRSAKIWKLCISEHHPFPGADFFMSLELFSCVFVYYVNNFCSFKLFLLICCFLVQFGLIWINYLSVGDGELCAEKFDCWINTCSWRERTLKFFLFVQFFTRLKKFTYLLQFTLGLNTCGRWRKCFNKRSVNLRFSLMWLLMKKVLYNGFHCWN